MTVPLALPVEVSPMFSPSSTDTKGGPLFDSRQLTITTPPAMHSLEYEEEYDDDLDDLFGEEEDPLFVDTRKPVATPGAGPSKPSSSAPVRMPKAVKAKPITSGQESRRKEKFSTSRRLDELRMRKATIPPPPSRGVPSLRNLAMSGEFAHAHCSRDEAQLRSKWRANGSYSLQRTTYLGHRRTRIWTLCRATGPAAEGTVGGGGDGVGGESWRVATSRARLELPIFAAKGAENRLG